MKLIRDFSTTASRTGPAGNWATAYLSPSSTSAPVLILDFKNEVYGLNGTTKQFSDLALFQRSGTKTAVDSGGQAVFLANDLPAMQRDISTFENIGLLMEPDATNLLLNSKLSGGAAVPLYWSQPIASGNSLAIASDFGAADAAMAYDQSASGEQPYLEQTQSVAANTEYVFSLLVENTSGNLTWQDIATIDQLPAVAGISYRMNGESVAAGDTVNQTGWLEILLNVGDATGSVVLHGGLGSSGAVTGSLRFSRPQFETGVRKSSFIPTDETAMSRAADYCQIPVAPWFSDSEGTLVFDIAWDMTSFSGAKIAAARGNAGKFLYSSGATVQCKSYDGTNVATANMAGVSNRTPFRIALAWSGSTMSLCANGNAVTAKNYDGDWGGGDIDLFQASGNKPDALIASIMYYSTRLNDAELQIMT